jgi:hypothetical protein
MNYYLCLMVGFSSAQGETRVRIEGIVGNVVKNFYFTGTLGDIDA